jgi:hypothetical protein
MCSPDRGFGITSCDSHVINGTYCPAVVQLSAATYSVGEAEGSATITVTRTADTDEAAAVDFATSDVSASSRTDYNAALGRLSFAAGETSKTFSVFITNDAFVEGDQTLKVVLGNAPGATLGTQDTATVTIRDDDTTEPTVNPLDDNAFFIRQHYIDFLGREPDREGLAHWMNQLTNCGNSDPLVCRVRVSAVFFHSTEFQDTGYLVYKTYGAAFGTTRVVGSTVPLTLNEFLPNVRHLSQDLVVGYPGWEEHLEANKVAYFDAFVTRSDFFAAYPPTMTAAQYVNALNTNAGGALSTTEREQLIANLTDGTKTRAQVLRAVAEDAEFSAAQFNRVFILMEYFGYLRRNPNDTPDANFNSYNFWLTRLNNFNGDYLAAGTVRFFITSPEYRRRFGTP